MPPWSTSATRAPRLVRISTRPSAASRRSASRTGVRDTPSSSARSSWWTRPPRGSEPFAIRSRIAAYTWSTTLAMFRRSGATAGSPELIEYRPGGGHQLIEHRPGGGHQLVDLLVGDDQRRRVG